MSQTALPQLYNSVKDDILKEMKDIQFYSATTDMWSSTNMTPYLSLTIHYISGSQPFFSDVPPVKYFFSQVPPNQRKKFLFEKKM